MRDPRPLCSQGGGEQLTVILCKKCGTRNEGLLSSGISLATKVGMALGTAAIAYTLAFSGYQAHAVSDACLPLTASR